MGNHSRVDPAHYCHFNKSASTVANPGMGSILTVIFVALLLPALFIGMGNIKGVDILKGFDGNLLSVRDHCYRTVKAAQPKERLARMAVHQERSSS